MCWNGWLISVSLDRVFLSSSHSLIVLDNEKIGINNINHTPLSYSIMSRLLIKINVYQLFRELRNRFSYIDAKIESKINVLRMKKIDNFLSNCSRCMVQPLV